MWIKFEICPYCGKEERRTEPRIIYNPSRDEYYYVWECFACGTKNYEDVEPEDVKNIKWSKEMLLWAQKWNEMASKYNEQLNYSKRR